MIMYDGYPQPHHDHHRCAAATAAAATITTSTTTISITTTITIATYDLLLFGSIGSLEIRDEHTQTHTNTDSHIRTQNDGKVYHS